MENYEELKSTICANIIKYRKHIGMTQLQLAETLNYSDKTISKWERGDSLPDLSVLYELTKIFNCDMNDLLEKHEANKLPQKKKTLSRSQKIIITSMATVGIWVLAIALYMLFNIIFPTNKLLWLCFIYAIPLSFIVIVIFNCCWGKQTTLPLCISLLGWAVGLSIYLTFNFKGSWLIFLILAVLQIIEMLWFYMVTHNKNRMMKKNKNTDEKTTL